MNSTRSRGLAVALAMKIALAAVLGIVLSGMGLGAQQTRSEPHPGALSPTSLDYSKTRSFANILEPYTTPFVPEQPVTNSVRFYSLIRNRSLVLSALESML